MFDDDHLVSCAGLVPVMTLAEQTVLLRLLDQKVDIKVPRTAAGGCQSGAQAGYRGGGDVCGRGLYR